MKNVINLYEKTIESNMEDMSEVKNVDMYKDKVDTINKLTTKYVDLKKLELEETKQVNDQKKIEYDHERGVLAIQEQSKQEKRKSAVDLLSVVVPSLGAIWGVVYTWHKEQDGINSSSAGREMTKQIFKWLKK